MLLATLALVLNSVEAANWAVLVAGSHTYENYRHQADVFHLYQILLSKGFPRDKIITMVYDDVKDDSENPFPGQVFNMPDEAGPGVDVRAGVDLDYTGDEVNVANFVGVLVGNSTTGGTGRKLDLTVGDDVFLFYVDHGAPGILEFPDGDVLHTTEFQELLREIESQKKYGRFMIYIEACNSGSILEGLSTDLRIYGVTAVGADRPSLGTYCGYEAVVNGVAMGTCMGDLFAVHFMDYLDTGDGSRTLGDFFNVVKEEVAIYAALHYGRQEGLQYGDIASFEKFTLSEFFYPDPATAAVGNLTTFRRPKFVKPKAVYSAMAAESERLQQTYREASAVPLRDGEWKFRKLKRATNRLQKKIQNQENVQNTIWKMIKRAYKGHDQAEQARDIAWRGQRRPERPSCEKAVHKALVRSCGNKADMTTAYALQFHQVVVNLCGDDSLGWGQDPSLGETGADSACRKLDEDEATVV